jgi:hypothetical protein
VAHKSSALPDRGTLVSRSTSIQETSFQNDGMDYYANTCKDCGANFGDFYLFSEPEHAFSPLDEVQAKRMNVIEMRCLSPACLSFTVRGASGPQASFSSTQREADFRIKFARRSTPACLGTSSCLIVMRCLLDKQVRFTNIRQYEMNYFACDG